jgi:hypothetical protein
VPSDARSRRRIKFAITSSNIGVFDKMFSETAAKKVPGSHFFENQSVPSESISGHVLFAFLMNPREGASSS